MADPYSNQFLSPPTVISDIDKETFENEIKPAYRPTVIKGFAKDWPLVSAYKANAEAFGDFLRSRAQKTNVRLCRMPSDNGRMFYSDDMSKMNFGVATLSADNSFERMLSAHRDASYAIQSTNFNTLFPSLVNENSNELFPSTVEPMAWIGNQSIVAPHFDEADNIAVVVAGRRRFTLFPPEQIANLYIGPLDLTPAGQPISLVNIQSPDIEAHPNYKTAFASGYSVELEPGDAIYIPTPWWHGVEALDSFNMLVNYWHKDYSLTTERPFCALLHVLQAYAKMPEQRKKSWEAMLQHMIFSDDTERFSHLPSNSTGVLDVDNRETPKVLDQWIKHTLSS